MLPVAHEVVDVRFCDCPFVSSRPPYQAPVVLHCDTPMSVKLRLFDTVHATVTCSVPVDGTIQPYMVELMGASDVPPDPEVVGIRRIQLQDGPDVDVITGVPGTVDEVPVFDVTTSRLPDVALREQLVVRVVELFVHPLTKVIVGVPVVMGTNPVGIMGLCAKDDADKRSTASLICK